MQWTYCDRWNGLLEEPISPFDAEEAHRRHETGQLYTAIGKGAERVELLVEIRLEKGYVGVKFLDDLGRSGLIYHFRVTEGRLFLRKMFSYDYGNSQDRGDDADPLVVESYTYTPDGVLHLETKDSRLETVKGEDYDGVNVGAHWEPIPTFGEYDSVTRWDREAE